jgi:hypothetical protein
MRNVLGLTLIATACNGCATSHYYAVRMTDPIDPISFQLSLDGFLRSEGLRPFKELFASNPQYVADVTGGLPRWDKIFRYSWTNGAGFVAVKLDSPYNPIVLNVGGSVNHVHDADLLERDLMTWLNQAYPNIEIAEKKITVQKFPW